MKKLKFLVFLLLVLISIALGQQIISMSLSNQEIKKDYAEINHIKYGLFSVDQWKKKVTVILVDEINNLDITKENRSEVKKIIEAQLNALIDKLDADLRTEHKGSLKGWAKQRILNIFFNIKKFKQKIPQFADTIILEISKEKNQRKIKTILSKKLREFISGTFDTHEKDQLKGIIKKYDAKNEEEAKALIDTKISEHEKRIRIISICLIFLCIILFIIPAFKPGPLDVNEYIFLVISLLVLLAVGIGTPMIDMEAKITNMSFVLLDQPVVFKDQVLYFQSKSILDVFLVMIKNKAIEMKLVGILVITFSTFFPIIKLFSSMQYYFNFKNRRENKIINFFVFKSGKWSMADVLVVAIFMAYIGFSGIITSQLKKLSSLEVDLLTTNGTSLQPGFYLFLTYVLLSLFLSGYLARAEKAK